MNKKIVRAMLALAALPLGGMDAHALEALGCNLIPPSGNTVQCLERHATETATAVRDEERRRAQQRLDEAKADFQRELARALERERQTNPAFARSAMEIGALANLRRPEFVQFSQCVAGLGGESRAALGLAGSNPERAAARLLDEFARQVSSEMAQTMAQDMRFFQAPVGSPRQAGDRFLTFIIAKLEAVAQRSPAAGCLLPLIRASEAALRQSLAAQITALEGAMQQFLTRVREIALQEAQRLLRNEMRIAMRQDAIRLGLATGPSLMPAGYYVYDDNANSADRRVAHAVVAELVLRPDLLNRDAVLITKAGGDAATAAASGNAAVRASACTTARDLVTQRIDLQERAFAVIGLEIYRQRIHTVTQNVMFGVKKTTVLVNKGALKLTNFAITSLEGTASAGIGTAVASGLMNAYEAAFEPLIEPLMDGIETLLHKGIDFAADQRRAYLEDNVPSGASPYASTLPVVFAIVDDFDESLLRSKGRSIDPDMPAALTNFNTALGTVLCQ